MPPETPPIPKPDRGAAAIPFLAHHGIIPVSPPIRSSDLRLVTTSPFTYYLTRRLGITKAFARSEALARGSWLHKCFELDPFTTPSFRDSPTTALYWQVLDARLSELRLICRSRGVSSETTTDILAREDHDARTAFAWYSAAARITIHPDIGSFRSYLAKPSWRVLARELTMTVPSHLGGPPLRAVFDTLLHNSIRNELWLVDLKSTSMDPRHRLSLCAYEFQAAHYLHVLREALTRGDLAPYQLPDNIKIGGILHIAIQKPTIKFGQNDRPSREIEFTPTRGKNKGITRTEREYYGEPDLSIYLTRCDQWYQGTHEFSHLAPERDASPPVNLSFTPISILDNPAYPSYDARLSQIHAFATCEPHPNNFPYDASEFSAHGRLTPWAHFAINPVEHWPEIMAREDFVITHRDEDPHADPQIDSVSEDDQVNQDDQAPGP
jgi:hypothetical protein